MYGLSAERLRVIEFEFVVVIGAYSFAITGLARRRKKDSSLVFILVLMGIILLIN